MPRTLGTPCGDGCSPGQHTYTWPCRHAILPDDGEPVFPGWREPALIVAGSMLVGAAVGYVLVRVLGS